MTLSESSGYAIGIIEMSFAIRLLMTPIQMMTFINGRKANLLRPEIDTLSMEAIHKGMRGDPEGQKESQRKVMEIYNQYGISNRLPLLAFLQLIFPLSWFFTITKIAKNPQFYPGYTTDGIGWVTDLSIPDPYFLFPIISGTMSYISLAVFFYKSIN